MNIQTSCWGGVFTAALVLSSATKAVRAEGSHTPAEWHSYGVNRVVRSVNNHREVDGTLNINFSQPMNSHGLLDATVDPYDNKPTAYLGGIARLATTTPTTRLQYRVLFTDPWTDIPSNTLMQVDGGLQFEAPVLHGTPLGWSAFISYNTRPVNPKVWSIGSNGVFASYAWRGGTYAENGVELEGGFSTESIPMRFRIGNAAGDQAGLGLMLELNDLAPVDPKSPANATARNRFFFHQGYDASPNQPGNFNKDLVAATADHPVAPWLPYTLNSTSQADANVKRVSGMTCHNDPDYHSELDGSQMRVTWGDCHIDGATWTSLLTNQAATGYDAPADNSFNDLYLDRRVNHQRTNLSHTIVEFPSFNNTAARAANPPSNPERYANETVNINLRRAAQPTGNDIEWAAP